MGCSRCGDLGWVPARQPSSFDSDVMPCPDCRNDDAVRWLKRRHPQERSLRERISLPSIRLR